MNRPPCSQRAKPTCSLLTSISNWGEPQPHTRHSFLPDPEPLQQAQTELRELPALPPLCMEIGPGGRLTLGTTPCLFSFRNKQNAWPRVKNYLKKGGKNVFLASRCLFARGHHNPAMQTTGRRNKTSGKGATGPPGAFKVIALVLFKKCSVGCCRTSSSQWNAPTQPCWCARVMHTHPHLNPYPAVPSQAWARPPGSMNQLQTLR